MPNPARPQYQDIIESTWGQAVADTVIRRYATAAARDADLAAFTPAQLLGQVVTVGAALLVHNGGTVNPWGPPGRIARVIADGTSASVTVNIPAWVASISADWQAAVHHGRGPAGLSLARGQQRRPRQRDLYEGDPANGSVERHQLGDLQRLAHRHLAGRRLCERAP